MSSPLLSSETFNASALPTPDALLKASKLEVTDERGDTVPFGDLFKEKRVVVVFVRHFFCGVSVNFEAFI